MFLTRVVPPAAERFHLSDVGAPADVRQLVLLGRSWLWGLPFRIAAVARFGGRGRLGTGLPR